MNVQDLIHQIKTNVKNQVGWKTERKIIVFSVDDYGNVRLHSKVARDQLHGKGFKPSNRFDIYDSLETRQDLEMLFDTLKSVKDKNNRHPVFTCFALPCNINFEKVKEENFQGYHYEYLPETYNKLSVLYPEAYEGGWNLWKDGIKNKLLAPQFHGREHLNVNVFNKKLEREDQEILANLNVRSYTSISRSPNQKVSPLAAFDFWAYEETRSFHEIIKDGLVAFENVFGFRAKHFTPPVYKAPPAVFRTLRENGIKYMDTALIESVHQGNGKYSRKLNYTGKRDEKDLTFIVRNVVFEPTYDRGIDWIDYTLKEIEAAFRWNCPAIISSHRVNFCGHIDPENRKKGLKSLKELLQLIVQRWPEVEFMAANELGDLIAGNIKKR